MNGYASEYVVNKANLGLELGLFNGMLDLSLDYFDERRNGIFMQRESIPLTAGFIKQPWSNFGKVTNRGAEAALNFNKRIGKDLFFKCYGNIYLCS